MSGLSFVGDLGGERSGSLSTVTVGESVVRGQGLDMFGMGAGGMPVGSGHGFAIGSLSWCGGSTLSYASGDVHAALWCKSVSMVLVGPRDFIGIHFLRNFLFRMVTLPAPSSLTTYWSNRRTSIIVPVLSYLRGCGPVWFGIRT